MQLDSCKSMLQQDETSAIRVDQSRVTLDAVVFAFHEGASPEEIASRFPDLTLAAVYSAIVFYLQNRSEVDAYLGQRESRAAELREKVEASPGRAEFRDRLLARARAAASA